MTDHHVTGIDRAQDIVDPLAHRRFATAQIDRHGCHAP
jgi:hypothetical protein